MLLASWAPIMTISSGPAALPINVQHVRRQFERRGEMRPAQFLYSEIAQRMNDRLNLIRLDPRKVLDAGSGVGHQTTRLRTRYPKASLVSQDHSAKLLEALRARHKQRPLASLLQRVRKQPGHEIVCADLADSGLPPESIDLVWSNLALHWHPRPHDVLQEWGRILRPGGLVFFSSWGPATGIELRQAIARTAFRTQTLPLVDMHDLGDLMIERGFADPVMDQETLRLTYQNPLDLLNDAWELGGNPHPGRRAGLAGRAWRDSLLNSLEQGPRDNGRLTLTIEVAYGHAWRSAIRRQAGETRISVQAIGKRSRIPPP